MEKLIIDGGHPLNGRIKVDGMKNVASAVLFASILTRGTCVIENLPKIKEVAVTIEILRIIGAEVSDAGDGAVKIDTSKVENVAVPEELVGKIRASYYLAGAMLARFGKTEIGFPGGCDFGKRPIDQHIKAFRALGAEADTARSGVEAVRMATDQANRYQAVILDWKMPDMDGIEAARRIRAQVGEDVPILLISAYDWSDMEDAANTE